MTIVINPKIARATAHVGLPRAACNTKAVKDNKITADKAIQIKSKLPQMIELMVTRVDND